MSNAKPETTMNAKDEARNYIKLTQTNEVRLAGTVTEKTVIAGKTKMKDNLPIIDAMGNVQTYPDRFNCRVSFVGGEITTPLSKEQYDFINTGEMYMFKGRLGLVKEFGNESVTYVFNSVEEL